MPAGDHSVALPKFSKDTSDFLLELADGKHDKQIAKVQRFLGVLGTIWPPARLASRAITVFVMINRWTAPWGGVVPDGRGGMVPKSNSRVHPTNGRFIKWRPNGLSGAGPAGWYYDDFIGGRVKENFPPP